MSRGLVMVAACLLARPAAAVELYEPGLTGVDLGGDVKTFFVGVHPDDDSPLLPEPMAMGVVDLRLKLEGRLSDWLRLSLHHQLTASAGAGGVGLGLGVAANGGGDPVPQALDLTWDVEDGLGYHVGLRIDRAAVRIKLPYVEVTSGDEPVGLSGDLTLGRQPVSFGSTFFFTPMDLVAPFSPTVIDREYKPGIDAARADVFWGTSGTVTAVAAYAGDWEWDQSIFAGRAGMTLDVFDVGVFLALARGDRVLGADLAGSFMGWALRGEATFTGPQDAGEDAFFRGALGIDRSFDFGLGLSGEIYAQTLGADKPADYLDFAQSARFKRGELWALGRYYAAASASYELLPIVNLGLFTVVNLQDASALWGPSLSWSIADEAALSAGGYFSVGARPEERTLPPAATLSPGAAPTVADLIVPKSEMGMSPSAVYVQLRSYF